MSTVNRKLTSILATDCVGFSGHMEKDEEKTLDNLKACRSIIDPYIEEFGGKMFHVLMQQQTSKRQSVKEIKTLTKNHNWFGVLGSIWMM